MYIYNMCIDIHVCIFIYLYKYIYLYIYTYVYTYMCIYVHIFTFRAIVGSDQNWVSPEFGWLTLQIAQHLGAKFSSKIVHVHLILLQLFYPHSTPLLLGESWWYQCYIAISDHYTPLLIGYVDHLELSWNAATPIVILHF